ncbi:cupredoxin domain-containing protein [Streptosporangium vulgare]|uniref:Cupredoxin domain-containing protein n=1 Tax=Streptosporangium vulgare TaxID=46190 RepID=A0ABV5TBY8_9ACTN
MTPPLARRRPLSAALMLGVTMLMALLTATACGSPSAAPGASTVKEITVTIAGRQVTPPPGRIDVTKGQTVRITMTGDAADEAHVHGYDKAADLKPGTPATIEFVADQDGLFEVETHHSKLQLFQLVVR